MTDPFQSPKSRLAYARQSLQDLNGLFWRFLQENPYARIIEENPETGLDFHKIKFNKPLPDRFSHDTAGIFNAIRSALDQTGWAAGSLSGGSGKNTYFPFANSESGLDNVIKGRCRDLPPDIVALFRSFKPFQGGDDLLWSVNEAANSDKHRMVVPVAVGGDAKVMIPLHSFKDIVNFIHPVWDWEKSELPLFQVQHGSSPKYQPEIRSTIALGDVGILKGKPAFETMDALITKASIIVAATEAECRRIGLLM